MIEQKQKEIRDFCIKNADPYIVKKYSRYFKNVFDGAYKEIPKFIKQMDTYLSKQDKKANNYYVH